MTAFINVTVPVPVTVHHDLLKIAAGRTVESGKPTSLANLAREALRQHFALDVPDAAPQGRPQRQKAASPAARARTRPASSPVAA